MGKKPKKPQRPVPASLIEEQVPVQLDFLESSMAAFDQGKTNEYRRMAHTIRLLLHDTGRSTSLLRQVRLTESLFLTHARAIDPRNLMTQHSLAMIRLGGGRSEFLPVLDQGPGTSKWISLDEWKSEIVIRDSHKHDFSRWDIVTVVADQDGGSHVDPQIEEAYFRLAHEASIGWMQSGPEGDSPMVHLERAYIRHIAYEVHMSVGIAWKRLVGNRGCSCGSGRKARYCCMKN